MTNELGQNRLVSLDVFRGMTIAGMVMVNNPGTWGAIYPPLEHAEWHGLTPTDLIFPFFLFIVGVAIPIALGKRLVEGLTKDVYIKIVTRAALIFLTGTFMAAFPILRFDKSNVPQLLQIVEMLMLCTAAYFYLTSQNTYALAALGGTVLLTAVFWVAGYEFSFFEPGTLRIPGVLQRIAVCYLIVSLLFLHTNWKQLAVIGGVILLFYWLIMSTIPVPGCGVTTIDSKACNLAAYVDRVVIGVDHIWRQAKVYDPEGLLSTLPALVTTIAGVLTGLWLKSERNNYEKVAGIFFAGVVLLAAAWCWEPFFPFNKALWTSSYVLCSAGLALCFLGFCYFLVDLKGYVKWTKPFVIFGVNALALYIGSGLMARMAGIIKVTNANGESDGLWEWIYATVFQPLADAKTSSLMMALSFIGLWLFLMWLLYRKRIFIKV